MIKKVLRTLGASMIIFALIITIHEIESQYLDATIKKVRGVVPCILIIGILILVVCEIAGIVGRYEIDKIINSPKRNEEYKEIKLLMKSYLEENEKNQEAINICSDDIKKRKEIIKTLYDENYDIEKWQYHVYRGYYDEVEEHFCENEIENMELALWDLRVIVCEMKRQHYHSTDEVLNKLEELCNKITHGLDVEEWMKISYVACLDELLELLKAEEMQGRIKNALKKLNEKRIQKNMLRKYNRYIPDKIKPCSPRNELEYYIWYLPYMIQKQSTLPISVIYHYIKFLDNSYKVLNKEIIENGRDYNIRDMRDYLAALELYDKLKMSNKEYNKGNYVGKVADAAVDGIDLFLEILKRYWIK